MLYIPATFILEGFLLMHLSMQHYCPLLVKRIGTVNTGNLRMNNNRDRWRPLGVESKVFFINKFENGVLKYAYLLIVQSGEKKTSSPIQYTRNPIMHTF